MNKAKISETLKRSFSKNFGWKVFSLVMAILSWFVVMNLINPTEIKKYSVYVTLLNEDKLENNEFAILNEDEIKSLKVDINIRATRPALDELNKEENRKNVKATIDLQQFDVLYAQDIAEPLNVSITPSLPSDLYLYDYEIVSFYPSTVSINLDNLVATTKTIEIEQIGDVSDGYVAVAPIVNPEVIEIRGAAMELDKISTVKAEIDLTNATSDVSAVVKPVIYDAQGNVLEGFNTNIESVTVDVVINKQGVLPVKQPVISGTLAEGSKIISVEYYPKAIEVIGDGNEMSKVGVISLPEINVDGLSENKTVVFDIRPYIMDTNLSIKTGTYKEVTVSIKIEKEIEKSFVLPIENISIKGINDNKDVELPETVSVVLVGLSEHIESITENDINASIDLEGLDNGSHNINLTLELPENVHQKDNTTMSILIKDKTGESSNTITEEEFPIMSEENTTTTETTTLEDITALD